MQTTNDALQLVRADLQQAERRREAMREAMPGTAALVDELRAAFGEVKVKYAKEGGREVGKPVPFEGTDVDKVLRYHDLRKQRRGKHG